MNGTMDIKARFGHSMLFYQEKLLVFGGGGIFMHPGPVNQGVEVSKEVLSDPRSRVLKQVKNGVYIRAAVLSQVLGIQV